jgi:hypothetical protein
VDRESLPGSRRNQRAGINRRAKPFETMDPTTFGPKSELVRDRLWVARMNQVQIVQQLADAEFDKDKAAICAWYAEAIRKNRRPILDACARGQWLLPTWRPRTFTGRNRSAIVQANAVEQWTSRQPYWIGTGTDFRLGEPRDGTHLREISCAELPERRATLFTQISVSCPQALAVVCGVAIDKLPWPLQHWFDEEPYDGNPILDRLDPADWKIDNPWRTLDLSVHVALSLTAYQARRAALGLPRMDVSTLETMKP